MIPFMFTSFRQIFVFDSQSNVDLKKVQISALAEQSIKPKCSPDLHIITTEKFENPLKSLKLHQILSQNKNQMSLSQIKPYNGERNVGNFSMIVHKFRKRPLSRGLLTKTILHL